MRWVEAACCGRLWGLAGWGLMGCAVVGDYYLEEMSGGLFWHNRVSIN